MKGSRPNVSRLRDRRWDVLLWASVPAALLILNGVGLVSGDAVKHANRFERGILMLNPNHLLMEPVAKLWFDLTVSIGAEMGGPDRLKMLDILVGSVSLALFRGLIPHQLVTSRTRANLATAALGGGFAYWSLWLSGEPIILQLPALVLAAHFLVEYVRKPSLRSAALAGACFGVATLFFISNSAVVLALTLSLMIWESRHTESGRDLRGASIMLATWSLVCLGGFTLGWLVASPTEPLHTWVLLYKGAVPAGQTAYGLSPFSLEKLLTAVARSGYGAVMALVDISPLVDAARDRDGLDLTQAVRGLVATTTLAVLGYLCLRQWTDNRYSKGIFWIAIIGWTAGVLAFGIYFNNSDDQFFVQLSVPVAVLVASAPVTNSTRRYVLSAAGILILSWNAGEAWRTQIDYPREERMRELESVVSESDVLIYAGHDEAEHLLHLLPDSLDKNGISLMLFAEKHPPESRLSALRDTVTRLLRTGKSIDAISIIGADPDDHPWGLLEGLGLPHDRVEELLRELGAVPAGEPDGHFSIYRLPRPDGFQRND